MSFEANVAIAFRVYFPKFVLEFVLFIVECLQLNFIADCCWRTGCLLTFVIGAQLPSSKDTDNLRIISPASLTQCFYFIGDQRNFNSNFISNAYCLLTFKCFWGIFRISQAHPHPRSSSQGKSSERFLILCSVEMFYWFYWNINAFKSGFGCNLNLFMVHNVIVGLPLTFFRRPA